MAPRKPSKPTATAELERLETRLAETRAQQQQVQAQAKALYAERDALKEGRIAAYAAENELEGDRITETIAAMNVKAETAAAKVAGADQRVRDAEAAVLALYERAGEELLRAQVERDQKTAEELAAVVHEALEANRRLIAGRQQQDAILARVPRWTPRHDGPPAAHAWESELRELERVVRQHPDPPVIRPRCLEPAPLVHFPE
jgi:Fic family protein